MPARRTEVRVSVEREVLGPDGPKRVRLEARLEPDPPGQAIGGPEIGAALESLTAELDAAVGPGALATGPAGRPREERALAELIDAYHPRQVELVDLLLEEGEITPGEHALLTQHLRTRETPAPTPREVPLVERPIAAAPLAADRSPTTPRPVAQLVELYRIESLRQAGAVRARRQISYEEYMALKRHFAEREAGGSPPPTTAEPST